MLRLSAIAASLKGEALSEEEEALATADPGGAEKLVPHRPAGCRKGPSGRRRKSCCGGSRGSRGGGGNVSRVTLGDYTVSYAGSAGGSNWAQSLTAWRKMKF